jgi:hypothetical protein
VQKTSRSWFDTLTTNGPFALSEPALSDVEGPKGDGADRVIGNI